MNPSEFLVQCTVLLESDQTTEVLQLLKDEENKDLVKSEGWELVGILCRSVKKAEQTSQYEHCLQILLKECKAKEFLLGIAEHLSETDPKKFGMLLEFTLQAFFKLEKSQWKYLQDIIQPVQKYCSFHLNQSKDGEKGLEEVIDKMSCVVKFIQVVVGKIKRETHLELHLYLEGRFSSDKKWDEWSLRKSREIMVLFMFDVMELVVPFVAKELPDLTSKLYQEVMLTVFQTMTLDDLMGFLSNQKNVSSNGVVAFLYLLFIRNICTEHLPLVYRSETIFIMTTRYLVGALKSTDASVITLALTVLDSLVSRVANCLLTYNVQAIGLVLSQGLSNVMVWCENEKLRKSAKLLLNKLLDKYDIRSRYLVLREFYHSSNHSGLCGYIITLLNTALQELHKSDTDDKSLSEVPGLCIKFLNVVVGENNVIHESDRIMAGLNFTRFWLLLRSKEKKSGGVWSIKNDIESRLNLISKCIDISRKELDSNLQSLQNKDSSPSADTVPVDIVIPGAGPLSSMDTEQQTQVINTALCTLDMMCCVIARIFEIMKESGK